MVDFRLRTPVRRAFSRKTSYIGYAVLCAGIAGILIFTLVTRAKQAVCSTWWISPTNAANNQYLFDRGVCGSTIVNSGALFFSIRMSKISKKNDNVQDKPFQIQNPPTSGLL